MLRYLLLIVALGASVACGGAPDGDPETTGTAAEAITSGDDDADDPAVVALLSGGEVFCTGVLVTKTVVLTAAHCVSPAPPDSVYFGSNPKAKDGTTIKVKDSLAHPEFDEDSLENDIGLVALASRAPADPVRVRMKGFDDSFNNAAIRIVGFGAVAGGQASAPKKRTGNTTIASFTDSAFKFHGSPSQTCNGDSGGPAFMNIGGADVLVGITSSGDAECKVYASDTRVDKYVDFIQGYVKKYSSTGTAAASPDAGGDVNSGCSSTGARPDGWVLPIACAIAALRRRRPRPDEKLEETK